MSGRLRALVLPGLLTLVCLAVLVSLGNWQMRRLAWKEDLIARATERPTLPPSGLPPAGSWQDFDVSAGEYRAYRLTGRYLPEAEVRVFTSLSDARGAAEGPGFWIVTPFMPEAGGTVLVNRGFVPQGTAEGGVDFAPAPAGTVSVTGLMRPDEEGHVFTPDDRPQEKLFFARDTNAIAAAEGLPGPVAPFTIDLVAAETPPGGFPQAGETKMTFRNPHLSYAVTWYGLAAALVAVFASFAWTRLRGTGDGESLTPPRRAP